MFETIREWDRDLFLYVNSHHSSWLDPVMYWGTQTWFWIPLYLFILFVAAKYYRKETWMVLAGIFITILFADQVTAGLMKPYFARLRPSREPSLQNLVYIVKGYTGGQYGFASSHAANTFGTAVFFWLLLRKEFKWIFLLFVWALFMCYTRLYLGVHYPGDILVGALVGVLGGLIGFWSTQRLIKRFGKNPEEALSS